MNTGIVASNLPASHILRHCDQAALNELCKALGLSQEGHDIKSVTALRYLEKYRRNVLDLTLYKMFWLQDVSEALEPGADLHIKKHQLVDRLNQLDLCDIPNLQAQAVSNWMAAHGIEKVNSSIEDETEVHDEMLRSPFRGRSIGSEQSHRSLTSDLESQGDFQAENTTRSPRFSISTTRSISPKTVPQDRPETMGAIESLISRLIQRPSTQVHHSQPSSGAEHNVAYISENPLPLQNPTSLSPHGLDLKSKVTKQRRDNVAHMKPAIEKQSDGQTVSNHEISSSSHAPLQLLESLANQNPSSQTYHEQAYQPEYTEEDAPGEGNTPIAAASTKKVRPSVTNPISTLPSSKANNVLKMLAAFEASVQTRQKERNALHDARTRKQPIRSGIVTSPVKESTEHHHVVYRKLYDLSVDNTKTQKPALCSPTVDKIPQKKVAGTTNRRQILESYAQGPHADTIGITREAQYEKGSNYGHTKAFNEPQTAPTQLPGRGRGYFYDKPTAHQVSHHGFVDRHPLEQAYLYETRTALPDSFCEPLIQRIVQVELEKHFTQTLQAKLRAQMKGLLESRMRQIIRDELRNCLADC